MMAQATKTSSSSSPEDAAYEGSGIAIDTFSTYVPMSLPRRITELLQRRRRRMPSHRGGSIPRGVDYRTKKSRCDDDHDDDVMSSSMSASSASNARVGGGEARGDHDDGDAIEILDSTTDDEDENENEEDDDVRMRIMGGHHPCGGPSSSSSSSSLPMNAAVGRVNDGMGDEDGNEEGGEEDSNTVDREWTNARDDDPMAAAEEDVDHSHRHPPSVIPSHTSPAVESALLSSSYPPPPARHVVRCRIIVGRERSIIAIAGRGGDARDIEIPSRVQQPRRRRRRGQVHEGG